MPPNEVRVSSDFLQRTQTTTPVKKMSASNIKSKEKEGRKRRGDVRVDQRSQFLRLNRERAQVDLPVILLVR